MQISIFWISVLTVSHKRPFCCNRHNTKCKKRCDFSYNPTFVFVWKTFHIHTQIHGYWQLRIVNVFVGTVYNKWGRCVSIKYSLLWNNHTKYGEKKSSDLLKQNIDFSNGCTIKITNDIYEVYLVFILYYDYIQVDEVFAFKKTLKKGLQTKWWSWFQCLLPTNKYKM